jgi:HK97 family phage major capsid protein
VTGASGSTTTPEGLFTKATVGFTMPTGNTTSITYAGLVELFHSVRPAYRPRGTFLVRTRRSRQVRQLKASRTVRCGSRRLQVGEPDTINWAGRSGADPDVAVPAANALCMGFGDVSGVLDPRRAGRDGQDPERAVRGERPGRLPHHRRTDGDIMDTLAFKTLKNSAT